AKYENVSGIKHVTFKKPAQEWQIEIEMLIIALRNFYLKLQNMKV
ncbi:15517_t:CDS:1, partial [Racocetra persica]